VQWQITDICEKSHPTNFWLLRSYFTLGWSPKLFRITAAELFTEQMSFLLLQLNKQHQSTRTLPILTRHKVLEILKS